MEYDMNKDLLPLGTIINIRLSSDKYVIIGYFPKDPKTGKIYDYSLVEYPKGLIEFNDIYAVDRDLVKRILHLGYETDASKKFKKEIEDEVNSKRTSIVENTNNN